MSEQFQLQVSSNMYYERYDNLDRFISYYHQIEAVRPFKGARILEVGIGNKTVTNYLRQHRYDITTCDFDKDLYPDNIADIRSLPFEDGSFDAILAYEIMEHIPFNDVPKALMEFARCTSNYVVMSVPYSAAVFELHTNLRLPRMSGKWHFALRLPYFMKRISIGGRNKEHYWELGRRSYSKKAFRVILRRCFDIEHEYSAPYDTYHYYFILKKRTTDAGVTA